MFINTIETKRMLTIFDIHRNYLRCEQYNHYSSQHFPNIDNDSACHSTMKTYIDQECLPIPPSCYTVRKLLKTCATSWTLLIVRGPNHWLWETTSKQICKSFLWACLDKVCPNHTNTLTTNWNNTHVIANWFQKSHMLSWPYPRTLTDT